MEMNRHRSPAWVAVWTGVSAAGLAAVIYVYFLGMGTMISWPVIAAWCLGIGLAIGGLNAWIFYLLIFRPLKGTMEAIDRMQPEKDRGDGLRMRDDWPGTLRVLAKTWSNVQSSEVSKWKQIGDFRKEFIGNLAHELRTPVQSIQGAVYTLHEGAIDDPEFARRFLLKAVRNIDRMTGLIDDLDAISKIESSVLELKMHRFNLVALADEILDTLEPKAKRSGIKLHLDTGAARQLFALGDEKRMGQVLTNLVVNSISYGNPGGLTTVRLRDGEGHIVVEVEDNGIGIPEASLPRIFERFYRVDASRSRAAGGSGLGLAIVKHIVEAHGDQIHVKSALGKGTTFRFRLKKG
jgi:two-component system phosphate regulon sensor histidine kinase PhoR